MGKFKLSALMLALVAANSAIAATEEERTSAKEIDPELEVIEVRGFSRSLIQSLNQKRFSDTVSEQLSADDLGALPDVSMADALTRLPGDLGGTYRWPSCRNQHSRFIRWICFFDIKRS